MPRFSFTITAPATVSARVEVDADTIEDARAKAVAPSFHQDPANKVHWELDDNLPARDVYLPDADDFEEVPASPKL